jgi:hypothetical protein
MKRLLLVLTVLLFFSTCYANVSITIKNESGVTISAFIDSVDHGLNKFGSLTMYDGILQPDEQVKIEFEKNLPPHRYIFSIMYNKNYNLEIVKLTGTSYIFFNQE